MDHLCAIWCAFLACGVLGCASGPEKQDPLTALAAEDGTTEASGDQLAPNAQEAPARQGVPVTNQQAADAQEISRVTIPFGPGLSRPVLIAGPTPSLPLEAIANRVMGVWVGRCVITAEGNVEDCHVVKGLPYSDAHIVGILKAQKYTPVIFEGKPQRVWYTFKIIFK